LVLLGLVPFAGDAVASPIQPLPTVKASLSAVKADAAGHDLYASFDLRDAFTDEVREEIATGLPITFTHYLEVVRRRPLWFDKTLVTKTISTTVTYDTLTRHYTLSKRVNDEVIETSVAVEESDMMRWMTSIERVRLADPTTLEGIESDSLYVRVKSRLRKKFVLLFVPWAVETRWEKTGLSFSEEGTIRGR
jgi:hypothetical protein